MTSKGPEETKKAASSAPAKEKEKEKVPEEKGQQPEKGTPQNKERAERPKREKKEKESGTGVVKSVLSGDRLVIYLDTKNTGPTWRAPEEKEIKLSNLKAPLPALKREGGKQGKREEENWCWHSKDFLRKLAVGKRVEYQIDFVPASSTQQGGRVYGTVRLLPEKGKKTEAAPVDLSQEVVAAGWAAVALPGSKEETNTQREEKKDNRSEYLRALISLEETAKSKQIGIWAKDAKVLQHARVRIQKPFKIRASDEEEESEGETFDATKAYKELRGQAIDGVVEHVHNGSMLRVLLLPSFREILLKIAGAQSPIFRRKPAQDEPFAQQAQFITERNILQRDVKVLLTAFEQQRSNDTRGEPTFYGELAENDVSIGERLLESGLARFVEWSAPKDKVASLRSLEEAAQKARKGIWQHEQVPQGNRTAQPKLPASFVGKVIEVSSGGSITVLNQATTPPSPVNVTLSSINVPRLGHGERDDDFFAWEAREFVRKKILGRKVQVVLDYVRPAVTVDEKKGKKGAKEGNEKKEEKVLPPKPFYTVSHEGKNVALGLVELGYAQLLEHRGQDRSPHYDALFLAQERARGKKLGVHGNPDDFIRHRVHDLSRSAQAAKRLYKSLETREGQKHKAIVEYVISGSRLKLCLPDQSCLITFFLGGARCPSVGGRKQGETKPVDPMAVEARDFTNSLLLHHDVEIAIDGQDKTGAFKGHLWYKKKNNLALDLLAKGFAEFSGMGKNSASKELEAKYMELEDKAKEQRLGVWKNYDPQAEAEKEEKEPEVVEASSKPQKELISITEVLDGSHFYFHILGDEHKQLEELMEKLQAAGLESRPAYPPERGDVVAVRFSDGQWYRAHVASVKSNTVNVFYGDYGNSDAVTSAEVRQLPAEFGLSELRWQAVEGGLAYIQTRSPEDEWGQEAAIAFRDLVWGKTMLATVEYRDKGAFFLLLAPSDNSGLLVNSELCRLGLAKMQRRIPRNANEKIIEWIRKEQEDAHKNHRGVFEYGDDGDEDDFEDRRPGGAGPRRK